MSELSFSDLLADGFVIGAILLCWWAIAAVLMLPEVALGESSRSYSMWKDFEFSILTFETP
ncbi:MAG: hypothetical protein IH933_12630 [Euryarchaeota archaeon]|nr:hypothetical protein [Euryarchaeota archaeon]